MKPFYLALRSLQYRWSNHLLSLLLFSLSIAILWAVSEFSRQSEEKLKANLANTDLVIGAKGSPLQVILSSLYHIDAPTGNISFHQAKRWMKHPMVREALPLAYGDYYRQYKIIGSDSGILAWYHAGIETGRSFEQSGEVVLGAAVARHNKLQIGAELSGQHGDAEAEEGHGHYHVVGILKPTGTVIDQLVLCNLETVWEVHTSSPSTTAMVGEEKEDRAITAVLIRYKNPMAAIQLPRMINENSTLQAAAPSIEINRLAFMLNSGTDTLKYVAYGILLLAVLSIFLQVWMGLNLRTREFALLRHSGYSRLQLFFIIYLEYFLIGIVAFVLGELMARGFLHSFSDAMAYGQAYSFTVNRFREMDVFLLFLPLFASLLVILLNTRRIFRASVADLLQND